MASPKDQEEQLQPLTAQLSSPDPSSEHPPSPASFQRFQEVSSPVRQRFTYARMESTSYSEERDGKQANFHDRDDVQMPGQLDDDNTMGDALPQSITKVEHATTHLPRTHGAANDIMTRPRQTTSEATEPFMSPGLVAIETGSTQREAPNFEFGALNLPGNASTRQSYVNLQFDSPLAARAHSEAGLLSVRSTDDTFSPDHDCKSFKNVKQTGRTWLSYVILALAIYGTVMSALFLAVALGAPRYGHHISKNGILTIDGATVLTSFLARTIELSFATVMVALLGQALTRKAHDKRADDGITLAELSMRAWILQPGTLITHWESVRYAGMTPLGAMSLLTTILALLYVTAANAVVQPQLRFENSGTQVMLGLVKTAFANPVYLDRSCQSPIPTPEDDGGVVCLQLEHTTRALQNYRTYFDEWSFLLKAGNGSGDLHSRPRGYGFIGGNTTRGTWVEQEFNDMAELESQWGFVVINISMAMPHSGVALAAVDPINKILQPEALDGQGSYHIRASVPSPVVHVLCAMLPEEALEPYVLQSIGDTSDVGLPEPYNLSDPYLGGTPLDDLFRWGRAYGEYSWPPVFPKLPLGHQTIINDTLHIPHGYGRDAIYLLGNSSRSGDPGGFVYPLCQIQLGQTPHCSTRYSMLSTGATMEAICENPEDDLAYIKNHANALTGNSSLSGDWPIIAREWARSLSLHAGAVNGSSASANSYILNTLIPKTAMLDPALPSIAEVLAVMAGHVLLMSSENAPFVQEFNYTVSENVLEPGNYQYFKVSIEAQQYASGGTAGYQRAFIVILFAVFLLNLLALIYFIKHRDWYADVCEPSNLFSLAINSPPSRELAGSCGGGPTGKQFRSFWKLRDNGGHVYMESLGDETGHISARMRYRKGFKKGLNIMMTPIRKAKERSSESIVS